MVFMVKNITDFHLEKRFSPEKSSSVFQTPSSRFTNIHSSFHDDLDFSGMNIPAYPSYVDPFKGFLWVGF